MARCRDAGPALWTVTEIVEGRSFTWTSGSPLLKATLTHAVQQIDASSRARLAVEFCGPLAGVVAQLTRKLNQQYLAIEAEGLRNRSLR